MTDFEKFKALRCNAGYTVRGFASDANISTCVLVKYENGLKFITSISLERIVKMFVLLHASLPDFIADCYDFEREIASKMDAFMQSKKEVSFSKACEQLEARIYQNHRRKRISDSQEQNLLNSLEKARNRGDKEMINSIISDLRFILKPIPQDLPLVNQMLLEQMHRRNFTFPELAALCDVSSEQLRKSINSADGVYKMHVGTVYKICLILSIPFDKLIGSL